MAIVRTILARGILYYRAISYWAANLCLHHSYRTESSVSGVTLVIQGTFQDTFVLNQFEIIRWAVQNC